MRIGYIILVHKYPDQLARIIERLHGPEVYFFVHVDKKQSITPFEKALEKFNDHNISFVKREDGAWGRIGIVKATLHALTECQESGIEYSVVISGQDYPIKSNKYIREWFAESKGKSFIEYNPISENENDPFYSRITTYHFSFPDFPSLKKYIRRYPRKAPVTTLIGRLSERIFKLWFKLPRKYSKDITFYKGFQWWALHKNAVQYILEYVDANPDYLEFQKYTFIPDELFFQTILLNHPDQQFRDSIVNDDLHYIDWGKPAPPYPAMLTLEDFEPLMNSKDLFARKVDQYSDGDLLDKIDGELLSEDV